MLKSEFVVDYASKGMRQESYVERPTGVFEIMLARPQAFVPYVSYALNGLRKFKKPMNMEALSEQFSYVVSQWWLGKLTTDCDGRVIKVRYDVDRDNLVKLNVEAANEELEKWRGLARPMPLDGEYLHFEFIYDYEDSFEDGSVYRGTISEEKYCTREQADEFYNWLRECDYTNISVFCQEDMM